MNNVDDSEIHGEYYIINKGFYWMCTQIMAWPYPCAPGGAVHFLHPLPFSFDSTVVSNANRVHASQSVNLSAASILFLQCSLSNFICFDTFSSVQKGMKKSEKAL